MRTFRITVCVIFIISSILFVWTTFEKKEDESHPPVITSTIETLELKMSEKSDKEKLMQGLQAEDEEDGDLTHDIVVTDVSGFVEQGISEVTYMVADRDGNSSFFIRKIKYTDYEAPEFSIIKEPVCKVGDSPDIRDFVSVEDKYDGDITDHVELEGQLDTNEAGLYALTLHVTNSMNDTVSYRMFMHVKEESENKSVVKLSQYSVSLEKNAEFNAMEYIDDVLNSVGDKIYDPDLDITNEVDTDKPGIYPVVYRIADYSADTTAVLMVEIKE